jgi:hypothetical protein
MDMTGEYRIPAPRDRVWAALNDPETLKRSIPGCDSLERTADNAFAATVVAKVGPVKAKFNGAVTLTNINPPESYTISGEGKGGAAGFAKGGADVALADDGEGGTILRYTARADIGGKLAQLGSRLIDGTARKMADEFFANFRDAVAGPPPAAAPAPAEPAAAPAGAPAAAAPAAPTRPEPPAAPRPPAPPPAEAAGLSALMQSKFVWAGAIIVVLMLLVILVR